MDGRMEILERQLEDLYRLYDFGECCANEFYSVGMNPPAEDVLKLRCLARKISRMKVQLIGRGKKAMRAEVAMLAMM